MFILVPYRSGCPPGAMAGGELADHSGDGLRLHAAGAGSGQDLWPGNPAILGLSKLLPDFGTIGMTNAWMLAGWGLKGLFGHMRLREASSICSGTCCSCGSSATRFALRSVTFDTFCCISSWALPPASPTCCSPAAMPWEPAAHDQRRCGHVSRAVLRKRDLVFACILVYRALCAHLCRQQRLDDRFCGSPGIFSVPWAAAAAVSPISPTSADSRRGSPSPMLMCYKGWITMERYEESLLQAWR